ncbi:MAG: hypothetical protein K2F63_06805, partial [Muribaculaceae bacterium]|nr:hypothetical protein [Muribaculaceae bacterium]
LYLVFVLTDGSVAHYRYDVTQQVRSAPDKRNVTVVIDNLELPPTEPSGPDNPTGGFDAAVNDWETIIINHIVGAA